MAIAIGLDIGTTSISALALNTVDGAVLATATLANGSEVTAPADHERGRSEWDADRMVQVAAEALRAATDRLRPRRPEVAGMAMTGQQHGVVLVDRSLRSVSPFVGWQDRRADETPPGASETWVELARRRLGPDAASRAGCRLATGFMGTTLFCLRAAGALPAHATACFMHVTYSNGYTACNL